MVTNTICQHKMIFAHFTIQSHSEKSNYLWTRNICPIHTLKGFCISPHGVPCDFTSLHTCIMFTHTGRTSKPRICHLFYATSGKKLWKFLSSKYSCFERIHQHNCLHSTCTNSNCTCSVYSLSLNTCNIFTRSTGHKK